MKRLLFAILSVALAVLLLCGGAMAAENDVVYISANGSAANDGFSPERPVATLTQAFGKVAANGTIVVMGDITQGNMTFPEKAVTITGKYGRTDYQGRINTASNDKSIWQITAATRFEYLTFNNSHTAGAEFISGPSLHFGQGIVFQTYGTPITPTLNGDGVPVHPNGNRFAVRMGSWTKDLDSAEVVLESGTLSWISGGNNKSKAVGQATIRLSGGASVTDFISGSGTAGSKVGKLTIELNGATLPRLCVGGHGSAQVGAADITLTNCNINTIYDARPDSPVGTVGGDVHITVNGGTLARTECCLPAENRKGAMELTLSGLTAEDGMAVAGSFAGWTKLTVTGSSELYFSEAYQGPVGEQFTVDAGSTVRFSAANNPSLPAYSGTGTVEQYQRLTDYSVRKLLDFTQGSYEGSLNVQGTAIHENYMVVLSHRGVASIYDLKAAMPGTPLATIPLGSYTGTQGGAPANHANQCMFGPVKWDESDPLPLLYVTIGNGAGYKEDGTGYWSRCAVERITKDENGVWSAQTVQVISINDEAYSPADDATGLTLGTDGQKRQIYKSVGTFTNPEGWQKLSWGWPAFFVDYQPTKNSAGKLYVHSARYRTTSSAEGEYRSRFGVGPYSESNNYIITEFTLPELPKTLPASSEAALADPVVLTPENITGQFETPYDIYVTQGGTMYQGRIYYSFGFGGSSETVKDAIRVYDVAQKRQIKALDLTTTEFMSVEPEDCCIYQGKLALSLQNKTIYVFDHITSDDRSIIPAGCTTDGSESIFDLVTGQTLLHKTTAQALGHDMTYHEQIPASCTADGTKEYYSCGRCGGAFSDASGAQTLDDLRLDRLAHSMTHFTRVEPTQERDGNAEYWQCARCGGYYADENGTVVLGGVPVLPKTARTDNRLNGAVAVLLPAVQLREMPFEDVPAGSWYEDGVRSAWEAELIDGMTPTQFRPEGQLTVAQTIKLAAVLRQRHTDGHVVLTNGNPWYATYLEYAAANNVIEAEYRARTAAELNMPVTRGEFVHILYGALESYPAINMVVDGAIVDVAMTDSYADEIYAFYRAGILTGADAEGTFHAENSIRRSEAAVILARLLDSAARQRLTLG